MSQKYFHVLKDTREFKANMNYKLTTKNIPTVLAMQDNGIAVCTAELAYFTEAKETVTLAETPAKKEKTKRATKGLDEGMLP